MSRAQQEKQSLLVSGQIARYCGVTMQTVTNWVRKHGFPAGKLPNGNWVTTPTLIDAWILARNPHRVVATNQEDTYGGDKTEDDH